MAFPRRGAAALGLVLLWSPALRAQPAPPSVAAPPVAVSSSIRCPALAGAPALASVDAEARLAYLARAFDREIADVDLWSWTWGSIYVGAGAAQATAIALVGDHATRIDLTVGAVSAAIGAASLYGLPLRVTLPLRDARRGWNETDRCRVLASAEAALLSVADTQKLSGGWVPHVGNVVFNAILAAVLGFGFGHWKSAALSAGIGVVVGEANVLTQPHRMPRVLDRYRSGALDAGHARWSVVPYVASTGGGLALGVAF